MILPLIQFSTKARQLLLQFFVLCATHTKCFSICSAWCVWECCCFFFPSFFFPTSFHFTTNIFMTDKIYWNKIVIIMLLFIRLVLVYHFCSCAAVWIGSSDSTATMDEYHWIWCALWMWIEQQQTERSQGTKRYTFRMTWLTLIMGQNSKWHTEQLNRYISDFSKTIHSIRSLDNYHSNNQLSSSDTANDKANNFVHNLTNSNSNSVTSPDPLSSLSTTTLLNNTVQSFTHRQLHNFSSSFTDKFSDAIQSALTSEGQQANTSDAKQSDNDENNATIITNYWMLLLIVLYFVVVLGGIFGNFSLIVTLFTQSSARLRNPLLVALCLADLMVTGIAAPLTCIALILDARKTITSTLICKFIHFAQVRHNKSAYKTILMAFSCNISVLLVHLVSAAVRWYCKYDVCLYRIQSRLYRLLSKHFTQFSQWIFGQNTTNHDAASFHAQTPSGSTKPFNVISYIIIQRAIDLSIKKLFLSKTSTIDRANQYENEFVYPWISIDFYRFSAVSYVYSIESFHKWKFASQTKLASIYAEILFGHLHTFCAINGVNHNVWKSLN